MQTGQIGSRPRGATGVRLAVLGRAGGGEGGGEGFGPLLHGSVPGGSIVQRIRGIFVTSLPGDLSILLSFSGPQFSHL